MLREGSALSEWAAADLGYYGADSCNERRGYWFFSGCEVTYDSRCKRDSPCRLEAGIHPAEIEKRLETRDILFLLKPELNGLRFGKRLALRNF